MLAGEFDSAGRTGRGGEGERKSVIQMEESSDNSVLVSGDMERSLCDLFDIGKIIQLITF